MEKLNLIKYRLLFAFMLGGLSNSIFSYVGEKSESDVFTIFDSIYVYFALSFIITVTILATIEQIKNK